MLGRTLQRAESDWFALALFRLRLSCARTQVDSKKPSLPIDAMQKRSILDCRYSSYALEKPTPKGKSGIVRTIVVAMRA